MPGVLVVDDSIAMRRILRRALSFGGLKDDQVFDAVDGLDALDKVKEHSPDLVLCDMNMPRMTGEEFVNELRMRGDNRRIVMVTSRTSEQTQHLQGLGVLRVIRKPFDLQGFYGQVADLLPQEADSPDNDDIGTAVDETVRRVFERVLYVDALALGDQSADSGTLVQATIPLFGGLQGRFVLRADPNLAVHLANELMGDEKIVAGEVIKELVNTLVGEFLEVLAEGGKHSVADFGLPDFTLVGPGQWPMRLRAFDLDGAGRHIFVGFEPSGSQGGA
jgi:CheY-like chemotaxis protein